MPFGRRRGFGGGGGRVFGNGPFARRQAVRQQNNAMVWSQGPAQVAAGRNELNRNVQWAQRFSPTAAGIIQQNMSPVIQYADQQVRNGQAQFSRFGPRMANGLAPRAVNGRIRQEQAATQARIDGMRSRAEQSMYGDLRANWWPIAREAVPNAWNMGTQAVGGWWGRTRDRVSAAIPEGWGTAARGMGLGLLGAAAAASPLVGAGMGVNQAVQGGAFSPANLAGAYARMKVGQVQEQVTNLGGQLGNAVQGGFQSLTRGLGFGGGAAAPTTPAAPSVPAVGGAGASAGGAPMGDMP